MVVTDEEGAAPPEGKQPETPKPAEKPPPEEVKEEPKGKGGKGKGKDKGKKGKKHKKTQEEIEREEREAAERAAEEQRDAERKAMWVPYEEFLDKLVSDKLINAVALSVGFFLDEMGDLLPVTPLFELSLELHDPNIVFVPSIYEDEPNSFYKLIEDLLDDAMLMGYHMERVLKTHEETNYLRDIVEDLHVRELMDEIHLRTTVCMELTLDYIKKFEDYAYLWLDDRQEYLNQFLKYARALSPEELDILKDENRAGEIKESPPTVEQFKEQIDFYQDLYKKLESIETEKILEGGWLRIDVKPLRQAVLNTVCKWGNMFKQHLYNHVVDSLDELENFIAEAVAAMQVQLDEDDYDGLLKVMGYLFKVKERQPVTDYMFEPLQKIIDLLKEYGVEFPEEIHVQLQEIPDRWIHCKKVTVFYVSNTYFLQIAF